MIYHNYGSTEIQLSAVGFGGMRFVNPSDIDTNAALVKSAYDMGINYFDTAPFYCEDKSETIFCAALKYMLKSRAEKPFYISTKSSKNKPDEVRKDLERSLKKLGLDYIDFYYCWCVITMEEYHNKNLPQQYRSKAFTLRELATGTSGDVEDPYGGNLSTYKETAEEISELLQKFLNKLRKLIKS